MKLHLKLAEDFGSHLGDGSEAAEYRAGRIDPYVDLCKEILIDFSGVRMANSSFVNALVTPLVENHGEEVLQTVKFKGCNPILQVLVESAIELGMQKIEGKIA